MIYNNILELIGNTPLVRINKLNPNPQVTLLAKLEFFNPAGSIKDRIGIEMIESAEKRKILSKKGVIIEATGAGNTGLGLVMTAAVKGYKTILVIPDKVSEEKRNLLRAYGAKVIVAPTAVSPEDERSYYKVTERLVKETPKAFQPNQYFNPDNPKAHFKTTGPEIWKETKGKVTHVVVGMGTGGTITGVGRFLKKKNSKIKIIGVDPIGSIFYQYFKTGKYPKGLKTWKMEGIGEDFIPKTIDFSVVDEVMRVNDKQAFLTARELAKKEGILIGGTSGAALYVAQKVSKSLKKGLVVVIFPDSGRSYLSKFYNDEWMRSII
ncbi:cystathionine beta-synthase [Candidatus Roizmanbacteria bacterium CG10_big_fil_rev_8_21_14_0_10_36_26]|uniref:Cystathionine beta-synthase n=1 Tax=Candidatus Roizmanbacteria bacterium CG10_big_fil_rev_8_21_14_0_10_36_26 TaxID=1974851 RepID=A0A2M8KJZ3_9BACT|nr:MAG: cystathionine beta-synthase [Candidatus Roizmanbacteria bacterium CG10_big_fil_rev_8_21_14_0_10_36_26]